MKTLTRNKLLLGLPAALLALAQKAKAATADHPNHMVRPDRIQAGPADEGRFLQAVGGKTQFSDGVPVPIFIKNANVNAVAGMPVIARDLSTGVLTLPSVPTPASSLELYCNGLRQAWGRDFTVNGAQVTPGPDVTINGVPYSPKGVFINALEIVGDWQR